MRRLRRLRGEPAGSAPSTLWARRYTVSQLLAELLPDRAFYEQSGGGVTIGGGEAATFPHFCLPLMDTLHREGIHVAVDTCGYAVTEEQREVLRRADLLLFDVKGLDEGRHIRNTGRPTGPSWTTCWRWMPWASPPSSAAR